MTQSIRRIGLSLGADLCWPKCYEEIVRMLNLNINLNGEQIRFEIERVTIEPFNLRQTCKYNVVVDRVTHWYHASREWIKKSILMDDLYVYNNPWAIQSMEKQTTYCAMAKLGLPVPDTWMIPQKSYQHHDDLTAMLNRYARYFDLGEIGDKIGYPLFMKPYDGGAWKGVSKANNADELRANYEQSGTSLMHLQRGVSFDRFVRCIGLGPQFLLIKYDPDAPLHDRYQIAKDFVSDEERQLLQDMAMTINGFFGWDFNSCESLHCDGVWYPIDFANACPDSQVTSLHYYFPWIVISNIRWSLFCAATKKRMRKTLDWDPYYEILEANLPYPERLTAYAAIGHKRMETERFQDFCDEHLGDIEGAAIEFFGTETAKTAIREKVRTLFPAHEVEEFTELFWQRVQAWRANQSALKPSVC
ncbi:MAG TPA: hypothetical protein PKD64_06105 [Pirellulaceae bacterium]|nr:hypothetical protein [Pirellulaceae bacterium]HMO91753.1 hypothetical protein [Pirellulaceae bacterium]HMP69552.1 hypothetical protein [Pirellulaceae bacterium]